MKLNIVIDEKREEEIIIYAHKKTSLIKEIEKLVEENSIDFLGKKENELIKFDAGDVVCFVVEDNKVFAHLEKEKLQIKTRLYKLEEVLPDNFIKINQSAIANIKKIKKFDTSFSGTLKVIYNNGFSDYVSRRMLKSVKERLIK